MCEFTCEPRIEEDFWKSCVWNGQEAQSEESRSRRVSFGISGRQHNNWYYLSELRTVENLGLPTQSLDIQELGKEFKYLENLSLQNYCQ